MQRRAASLDSAERPHYLEVPRPLVFPVEAEVPQSQLHLELRTLLYQLLSDYLGLESTVGSNQFVYYDASDPAQSVAPDVYVRLEPRGEPIRSWKTWERGAPELAVELISESDASTHDWNQKLDRYQHLGVRELVRFDPACDESTCLRIWDRVDDVLVERALFGTHIPSSVLPVNWVVAPADGHVVTLRIADEQGTLILTRDEARAAAEARIRELEAELQRLGKG
jgi:Uma2 family endonuclease